MVIVPVVTKAVGGILVGLYLLGSAGLTEVNNKINQRQQEINEQSEWEIEEIREDFDECVGIHIREMVDNDEVTEPLTGDYLYEIKDEVAEIYSRNFEDRIDISDTTFEYMKKQLDKDTKELLDKRQSRGRENLNQEILYEYLRNIVIKEVN